MTELTEHDRKRRALKEPTCPSAVFCKRNSLQTGYSLSRLRMPGDLYVPYLSRTIPGQTLRHLKWFVNVETIFDNLDLTVISIPLPQVIDSG